MSQNITETGFFNNTEVQTSSFWIIISFSVDFCLSFALTAQNFEKFALEPLEYNHFEHYLKTFHSRWVINITDYK
jgi:hypothetical protein